MLKKSPQLALKTEFSLKTTTEQTSVGEFWRSFPTRRVGKLQDFKCRGFFIKLTPQMRRFLLLCLLSAQLNFYAGASTKADVTDNHIAHMLAFRASNPDIAEGNLFNAGGHLHLQ